MLTRLPVSMMPLALLLLVAERTGSLGWAGLAAGAHIIGHGLANDSITRRYSQVGFFRPMMACAILYPLITAIAVVAAYSGSAWWLVPPLAFGMGAVLPVTRQVISGAWQRLHEEIAEHDAPAVRQDKAAKLSPLSARIANTLIADLSVVVGPLIVALLMAANSAGYAVGIAALLMLIGSGLLLTDGYAAAVRVVDPREPRSSITRVRSAESRSVELSSLWVAGAAALGAFGALSLAVVGFARDNVGHPALAGVLLAGWGVGGFVGGLVFSSLSLNLDRRSRYRTTLLLVFLVHIPLLLVDRLAVLAVFMFVAGACAAATSAAHAELIGRVAAALNATNVRARLTKLGAVAYGTGLALGGIAEQQAKAVWPAFAICVFALAVAWAAGALGPYMVRRVQGRHVRPPAMHSKRA
jgi:MFS family permease